jgi:sulfur transfer protein SufE
LSTLVMQLQQTRSKDSDSLLLILTDNVLNKLTDLLSSVKNNSENIHGCESELYFVNVTLSCLPPEKVQSMQEFSKVCSNAVS